MYISISSLQKLNTTWWILKIAYGLLFIITGADKFLRLLVDWQKYISPAVIAMFPLSPLFLLMLVGAAEIALGIALLVPRHTKLGAYLAIGWLLIVISNLLSTHHYYDIAIRDIVILFGVFALAQITTIRERISSEEVV